jgi:hypothetical protein
VKKPEVNGCEHSDSAQDSDDTEKGTQEMSEAMQLSFYFVSLGGEGEQDTNEEPGVGARRGSGDPPHLALTRSLLLIWLLQHNTKGWG